MALSRDWNTAEQWRAACEEAEAGAAFLRAENARLTAILIRVARMVSAESEIGKLLSGIPRGTAPQQPELFLGAAGMIFPAPQQPERYRHYKGGIYERVPLGEITWEEAMEDIVVYRSVETGQMFARLASVFHGLNERGEKRFTLLPQPGTER